MYLPQRIYELCRSLSNSALARTLEASADNMKEFQDLLNQSHPTTPEEVAWHDLIRRMYRSNNIGFLQYVTNPRNQVSALVLWTESKQIARFFKLTGIVHIGWDSESRTYVVVPYVPREVPAERVHNNTPMPADQSHTTTLNTNTRTVRGRGGSNGSVRGRGGASRGRGVRDGASTRNVEPAAGTYAAALSNGTVTTFPQPEVVVADE